MAKYGLDTLYKRLSEQREKLGISKKEAADILNVKYSRYVNWENGTSSPSLDAIAMICEKFKISADYLMGTYQDFTLGLDEAKIIKVYRSLSPQAKDLFRLIVRDFDTVDLTENSRVPISIPRPIYEQSASAGTGSFLDSSKYTMIEFPEDVVPHEATFGVRVSGNSMEPDYPDGSIVFVKQMKNLRPGDVGIFTLNGEGYIKELGDNTNLISRNKDYEDIIIKEYDDLRVIGKVVGKPYLEE